MLRVKIAGEIEIWGEIGRVRFQIESEIEMEVLGF